MVGQTARSKAAGELETCRRSSGTRNGLWLAGSGNDRGAKRAAILSTEKSAAKRTGATARAGKFAAGSGATKSFRIGGRQTADVRGPGVERLRRVGQGPDREL